MSVKPTTGDVFVWSAINTPLGGDSIGALRASLLVARLVSKDHQEPLATGPLEVRRTLLEVNIAQERIIHDSEP